MIDVNLEKYYNKLLEAVEMDSECSGLERKLGSSYPGYKQYLKEIDYAIDNYIISTDKIVDKFYKTRTGSSKSKYISIDNSILQYVANGPDCGLKKKITSSISGEKQKSEYVHKKNFNFITKVPKQNDFEFSYLTESDFRKLITSMKKYFVFCVDRNCKQTGLDTAENPIPVRLIRYRYENRLTKRPIRTFFGCSSRKEFAEKLSSLDAELIKDIVSSYSSFKKTTPSLSSIFNSVFDSTKHYSELVSKNTTTKMIEVINPISGFKSIKNSRIPLSKFSEKEKLKVESQIKEFSSINSIFKYMSDQIDCDKARFKKNNSFSIKLVSGDEICAMYNVSSYYGSSYNYNNSDYPIEGMKGGTLFNSCMRRPSSKYDIEFYAKADFVKLLVISDEKNKIIKARAVVWHDIKNDKFYVDRVYTVSNEELTSVANYVNQKDNFYYIHPSLDGYANSTKRAVSFLFEVNPLEKKTGMPYLDSIYGNYILHNNKMHITTRNSSINLKTMPENEKDIDANSYYYERQLNLPKQDTEKEVSYKYDVKSRVCASCGKKELVSNGILIERGDNRGCIFYCSEHIKIINGKKSIINGNGTKAFYIDEDSDHSLFYDEELTCGKLIKNPKTFSEINSYAEQMAARAGIARAEFRHPRRYYSGISVKVGLLTNIKDNRYRIKRDADYCSVTHIKYDENVFDKISIGGKNFLIKRNMTEEEVKFYKVGIKEFFAMSKPCNIIIKNAINSISKAASIIRTEFCVDLSAYNKENDTLNLSRVATLDRCVTAVINNGVKDMAMNIYSGANYMSTYIPVMVSDIHLEDKALSLLIETTVDEYVRKENANEKE